MKYRWLVWLVIVPLMLAFPTLVTAQDASQEEYGAHYTLYGDLTLDGKIGAEDALEVLKLVVGKSENDRMLPAADVTRDGNVGANDALEILKHTVGKPTLLDTLETVTVHWWEVWQEVTPATRDQAGLARRDCALCDAFEERELPKLPPIVTPAIGEMEAEVLRLVNVERQKAGLAPLAYYVEGQAAAELRAQETDQVFSHTRPDGSSCFTVLAGIPYYAAGENIAMGQVTPAQVMDAWMNSQGHRANILSEDFTHIMVGVVPVTQEGYIGYAWVQLFLGLN